MTPQHKRTTDGSPNGIYGKFDINHPLSETYGDSGSAARFFYCAKASKSERNAGLDGFEKKQASHDGRYKYIENPYQRHSNIQQNNHPTVKPIKLMEYLVKLVTPENAIVLDPFMGSGSTGIACVNLNRKFIGMELDKDYFEIAKARINEATTAKQLQLF